MSSLANIAVPAALDERPQATTSRVTGRIPPQNLEAECSVLGGILLDPEAIHTIIPLLTVSDFYSLQHQEIYRAMLRLCEASRPIDLITLNEELVKTQQLEKIGGSSYLAQLADFMHTSANIQNYAHIVREKSTLREVISRSTQIVQEAYGEGEHIDEFLDRIESVIFGISEKRSTTSLTPIAEVIKEGFKAIERNYDAKGNLAGIMTGYHELDRLVAGLNKADLMIVAGRPSMGKTAFALNIAQNVALHNRIPVAVFSLEMSRNQLAQRLLCSEGRVDSTKVRGGSLSEEDWIKLTRAAGELAESPIFIDDTAQISALEMRAKARRLKAAHGLGLVIVDYLQLMRGHSRFESREREISEISRSLKAMAKELDVPVIALSQLNRAVEGRQDKRPMMVDLRESGAIEQDADIITFIYRDEVYNTETPDQGIAEIIVGKHRNGPTGVAKLAFIHQYTRFENLEYRYNTPTPT